MAPMHDRPNGYAVRVRRHLLVWTLTIAISGSLSAGCARFVPPSATPIPPAAAEQSAVPTSTNLGSVEVSSYKGKPLDTVASEPENSIKGPQDIDRSTYQLAITGKVKTPLYLTYTQVRAMPSYQKVTTLNCVEGWSKTYLWQGVRIRDLLSDAGYDPAAKIVIFTSYDGYSTSLPLDYVVERELLLAYAMNGKEIPPERGFPFQVVAEDRLGYKWAKWVTGIEVSDNGDYQGYWEQRGYDNDAKLPGAE
jgi:DMSO/TMAO reductase YedYZ molybdopterin-dependent catalytic subunit